TPQEVAPASPLCRYTVPDSCRGRVEPCAVWLLLLDTNAELGLLITGMMLEPLKTRARHALTSVVVIATECLAKAAGRLQDIPSHGHVGADHVAHGCLLHRHPAEGASYNPAKLVWEPAWARRKPQWLDLPPNPSHTRVSVACGQALHPIGFWEGIVVQERNHRPARDGHT